MAVIKTALEIALERTQSVKSDKSGIEQFDAKQKGKKLANSYLAGEADLAEEIKKTPDLQKESLKNGVFDVLLSQISLPVNNPRDNEKNEGFSEDKRIELIGKGLSLIIKDKKFAVLYQQLVQVYARFSQESAQYEQLIRQQYAPKLRQKEEELSRRLGREIRIDPMQDPEFVTFHNQHMNALKGNYEPVIEQVKDETRKMYENIK